MLPWHPGRTFSSAPGSFGRGNFPGTGKEGKLLPQPTTNTAVQIMASSFLALRHAAGTASPGELPERWGRELSGLQHVTAPQHGGQGGRAGNWNAREGSRLPKRSASSSAPPDRGGGVVGCRGVRVGRGSLSLRHLFLPLLLFFGIPLFCLLCFSPQ